MMQKARSRLKKPTTPPSHQPIVRRSLPSVSLAPLKKRAQFLPLLISAGVMYGGLAQLLTKVRPELIENWPLPKTYLPFHLLLGLGNFFFFTFLTLKKRWGIFAALGIQWLFFLKLQNISLDLWAWGSALAIGAGGYSLRTWWKNRL